MKLKPTLSSSQSASQCLGMPSAESLSSLAKIEIEYKHDHTNVFLLAEFNPQAADGAADRPQIQM
jgi:hypothetical protein